ncbi:MAG TPA: flagellar hook-length control protein FliK [Mesorhizobium sp.]|nr:flagellar hook-length control protein FliK [Mesorhizobium sp.]
MNGLNALLPRRADAAGAAKGGASREGRLAENGFGDVLDNGGSAKAGTVEERTRPDRPVVRRAAPSEEKLRDGEIIDAAAVAALAALPTQRPPAPEQAAADEPAHAETPKGQDVPAGRERPNAIGCDDAVGPRGLSRDTRTELEMAGRPAAPLTVDARVGAAEPPQPSQPASAGGSNLPPELAALLSASESRAIVTEADEPSSSEDRPATSGSSLSRLNAAVAFLDLGGLDARQGAGSERHARGGAAGPAAREQKDAPRFGAMGAEETPKPAGEPREAFAARAPAAAAALPANPGGLALPVAATPLAVAETLAANLPAAAAARSPSGPLPAHLPRSGDPARVLTLELKPDTLGSVTARLRLEETRLAVEITVTTAEARDRLGADGGEIAQALEALGLSVDRVTVSLDETRSSRDNGEGRAAGEGRFAAPEGQAGRGEDGGGGRPRGEHGAGPTAIGPSPGPDLPGGVYI